jgi:hypothetical protein
MEALLPAAGAPLLPAAAAMLPAAAAAAEPPAPAAPIIVGFAIMPALAVMVAGFIMLAGIIIAGLPAAPVIVLGFVMVVGFCAGAPACVLLSCGDPDGSVSDPPQPSTTARQRVIVRASAPEFDRIMFTRSLSFLVRSIQ